MVTGRGGSWFEKHPKSTCIVLKTELLSASWAGYGAVLGTVVLILVQFSKSWITLESRFNPRRCPQEFRRDSTVLNVQQHARSL